MKPELFYAALLAAIILVVSILGGYLTARNEKRNRDRNVMNSARQAAEFDEAQYRDQ